MKTIFSITLRLNNGTRMNLTAEGFRSLQRDAQVFDTEAEARAAFAAIDEQSLLRDGFRGFHELTVRLDAYTLEADDEVAHTIVIEKKITVDSEAA